MNPTAQKSNDSSNGVRMRQLTMSALAGIALLLSACSFSLAGDVTPPPHYTPPALPQSTVVATEGARTSGLSYPLLPPDPAKGAPIYTEKCTPCHGSSGLGDGPRASSLPKPVAAIGSAELARKSTPADWFGIVTNGKLESFMPPFSGSLSDGQRWDILAYVYTLSETPAAVATGGQLYDQNCASCHGKSGKGDGPNATGQDAAGQPSWDFTDQAAMAQKTNEDIYQAISSGNPPAMPAYKDKFSEAQRRALADSIRFLSFAPSARAAYTAATPLAAASTASTQETTMVKATLPPLTGTLQSSSAATASVGVTSTIAITATQGIVTGQITNGSGGPLPSGLEVSLHGFDNMQLVVTGTITINARGIYTFTNIGMPGGRIFVASTTYKDTTYSSNMATIDPGTTVVNLDVSIYDTTTDTSSLSAERMHVFFDFSKPGIVQVIELYLITNPTNKTIVAAKNGDAVLTFKLPDGATNLQFQDSTLGQRYLDMPGGFGDTSAISPGSGQHQVLFGFDLPYTKNLDLHQPVNLPVAAVVVLLPEGGVKIKSNALTDAGTRDVQGTAYQMYNGGKIDTGGTLDLTLTGSASQTTASPLAADSRNNLIIGLGALGLVLILVGVLFYRRTQQGAAQPAAASAAPEPVEQMSYELRSSEDLIDAIIALDDLYKEGNGGGHRKLPEEAYRRRRAELKAQLKDLMDS
jgi:mono/diheme cytochrome c family protein